MAIIEEILEARSDSNALISLIERFAPLLKKYAGFLRTEDAYADLQLKFIELILRFNQAKMRSTADPHILSYLRRSIHNHYIFMAKQEKLNRIAVPISSMLNYDDGDNVNDFMDKLCSAEKDDHQFDDFDLLYKNLTAHEADVIIMRYYYNLTSQELSTHFAVSPSAISQTKSNAIRKLKAIIKENL